METETTPNTTIVRAVGVIDENKNFIPYGSTAVAKGIPVFVFNTKAEYDEHAPTLPEPCVVITLDDIDTGGFEFDSELSDTSENAVQNKVIKAALEALKEKASFTTPGMVQFTDATTITDRNSGYALSAIEKNASVEGSLSQKIETVNEYSEAEVTIINGVVDSAASRPIVLKTGKIASINILLSIDKSATIASLPIGYRPKSITTAITTYNSPSPGYTQALGFVTAFPNGNIVFVPNSEGNHAYWICLTYMCE